MIITCKLFSFTRDLGEPFVMFIHPREMKRREKSFDWRIDKTKTKGGEKNSNQATISVAQCVT